MIVAMAALVSIDVAAQARWGVVAGIDVTNLKFNQPLIDVDRSVGYSAGLIGELMFPGIGFGVDASLLYTQQGATLHLGQQKIWSVQGYGNERSYLHYLEVPINLKFKYSNLNGIENTIAPYVYGGPCFSFLVGHSKVDALEYPGMTFGLQAGIGAEIVRKFQVSVSYCWGMSYSVRTKQLDGFSAHNRNLKVSCAWMF